MYGAIKHDSVYDDATPAFSDDARAVVAGSLVHNLTMLWTNEKACWSIFERGM